MYDCIFQLFGMEAATPAELARTEDVLLQREGSG